MAEGLNRAMLLGNLTADPDLRETPNGRAKLSIRMATNESYMNPETKERKEMTQYHNVALWGPRAEGLKKILSKGSHVYVEGRIETRSYDDKDGVKRTITEIVATNLLLLGSRRAGDGDAPHAGGGGSPAYSRPAATGGGGGGGGGGYNRPAGGGGPSGGGRPAPAPEPHDEFGAPDGNSEDDIPF